MMVSLVTSVTETASLNEHSAALDGTAVVLL
jgi:hypothetical protein